MDNWVVINKPLDVEADIPLENQAPADVKEKYANTCKYEFVAWGFKNSGINGCIRSNRSILIDSSKAHAIELSEMEPAKGGGYVSLEIKTKSGKCLAIIASARYSQKSLAWLKLVQSKLVKEFSLKESYQYCGKDA